MASAANQVQPEPCSMAVESGASPYAATIVLDGELDLANADTLRAVLQAQRQSGRRHVRVDASRVAFVDATVLGVLYDAHHQFLARGGTLVLCGLAPRVQRLLRLAGLDEVLFVAAAGTGQHAALRRRPRRLHAVQY